MDEKRAIYQRMEDERLPRAYFKSELDELDDKISAVNSMSCFECGE